MKHQKTILLLLFYLSSSCAHLYALKIVDEIPLTAEQQQSLDLLNKLDTLSASTSWPNIVPAAFYNNVKKNILFPEKLYQGHATNFCGYSALSVVFISKYPLKYTQIILSLYQTGMSNFNGLKLAPSEAVRLTAGTLLGKGKLNQNPADQIWLLTLPDQFKGYMNTFNRRYDPGDEDKMWASTTLAKFNRMARKLCGFNTQAWGSDLVRPNAKSNVEFINTLLQKGMVVLFVNSKFLHPAKFRIYNFRMPTHYIVLYSIQHVDDRVALCYWDYGLKTVTLMSKKRLRKLIYGITLFNEQ